MNSHNTALHRSVLIAGATGGIGSACTNAFANLGWTVFAGHRPDSTRTTTATSVFQIPLDITDASSIAEAVTATSELLSGQPLTALLHCAGIAAAGPLLMTSADLIQSQMACNLLGPTAVTQAFLPYLDRRGAAVVFLGSPLGHHVRPYAGAYAASKYALRAVAETLRMELVPLRVAVHLIEPDKVDTPIWDRVVEQFDQTWNASPVWLRNTYPHARQTVHGWRDVVRQSPDGTTAPQVAQCIVDHILHSLTEFATHEVGTET
ncbi:MAG: SDR family NAD(P)-dependent oxidoreductase [Pirellulaceae bacterium]|nr:SDR family NAD(P)-dependent oxidoreductase [Planctomycetales bacterium]